MELALFIYLASVAGNVGAIFGVISILSASALFAYALFLALEVGNVVKLKKRYILVPFLCALIAGLIPSEKTLYLMLAGYASQQVIQSDTGEKVKKVIDAKLDDYLADIESKAKGEKK